MKKRALLLLTLGVLTLAVSLLLSGCGGKASLEDYTIVIADEADERTFNAAREVQTYLKELAGKTPAMTGDASAGTEQEILIGTLNRAERDKAVEGELVTTMDYVIKVVDKKIVIAGASTFATAAAADKFLQLAQAEELQLKNGWSYTYHFDPAWMNPLCNDPESFVPVWADTFTPPEWMLDPYESMYAVTHATDRMASLAHRTDFVYYPECSLEGMLSCIMAGVDAIELDVRLTKDNIPVVLHDEKLNRLTDFGSKAGKDGLPASEYVGDWTYEQLRELNMLMSDGSLTDYKVPTLYECLYLAGQYDTMLTLDEKADETATPVFAATETSCLLDDMQSIAVQTDTLDNLLYYYRYWKKVGSRDYFMNVEGGSDKYYEMVEFWFDCEEDGALNKVWSFWGDSRYKSWGQGGGYEKDSFWKTWFDEGIRTMWSNKAVDHAMYIAENYSPADYSALKK